MSGSMRDFQVLQKLGEGSFSVVYKVKRTQDQQEYALKKVKLPQLKEKERQNALNEVRLLASLDDHYIVAYKDAFIDDQTSSLCIIMELLSGGDLQKKISSAIKGATPPFSEADIWRALLHMTSGLKSLHDANVVHRDLKCANVFLSLDGKFKLGDLNVSKVAKMGLVYTQTGTPYYASPEVWRDEPYDTKSDIWSLGCVLYEMATLKPPFRAQDMDGLYKKVQKGAYDPLPSRLTKDLAEVIAAMLRVKPSQRPSCDQILSNALVVKHVQEELHDPTDQKAQLLKTIQLPKNVRSLKERLPKSKYHMPVKEGFMNKSVDKVEKDTPQEKLTMSRVQSANMNISQNKSITPERYNHHAEKIIENNSSVHKKAIENSITQRPSLSPNQRKIQSQNQVMRPKSYNPITHNYNQYQQSNSNQQLIINQSQNNQSQNISQQQQVSNSIQISNQQQISNSYVYRNNQSQINPNKNQPNSYQQNNQSPQQINNPQLSNQQIILQQSRDKSPKLQSQNYNPRPSTYGQIHGQQSEVRSSAYIQSKPQLQMEQYIVPQHQKYHHLVPPQEQSARQNAQNTPQTEPQKNRKEHSPNVFPQQAKVQSKKQSDEIAYHQQNNMLKNIGSSRPYSSNIIPDHHINARQRLLVDHKPQFNIITNAPYNHYYPVDHLRSQLSDPTLIKQRTQVYMSDQVRQGKPQYKLSEVQKYQNRRNY